MTRYSEVVAGTISPHACSYRMADRQKISIPRLTVGVGRRIGSFFLTPPFIRVLRCAVYVTYYVTYWLPLQPVQRFTSHGPVQNGGL